jgi:hypothetical protein
VAGIDGLAGNTSAARAAAPEAEGPRGVVDLVRAAAPVTGEGGPWLRT